MFNGLLIVRKEKGYTSNDVVAILRGILKQKKIGHTGTLDPDAEGVLPICLGQATKLAELLTAQEKVYEAGILLGRVTDTQDISGKILETSSLSVSEQDFREAARSFQGDYLQIPPMYSAVKIGGKRLYEIARKGGEVERQARPVTIHSLTVDAYHYPEAQMTVSCSKGTYIRTLCHDIGQKLGCGACMSSLIRTRSGRFGLGEAMTLEEIKAHAGAGDIGEYILSPDRLLKDLPVLQAADADRERLLKNGNPLSVRDWLTPKEREKMKDGQLIRIRDTAGVLTGVYRFQKNDKYLRTYKMLI